MSFSIKKVPQTVVTNTQRKVQTVSIVNGVIDILPTGGDLVVIFDQPIDNTNEDINITVNIDLTKCNIGDRLFILTEAKTGNHSINMFYNPASAYLTFCGSGSTSINVNKPYANQNFIFNSKLFVNTLDNC